MDKVKYRYIDLQSLKEETFGEKEILVIIIELFLEGIDEYITVLNEEIKNRNWGMLFKATHKIKPNISMFGITELEPTIYQLEKDFRDEQNLETVDKLVTFCLSVLREVKVELESELISIKDE